MTPNETLAGLSVRELLIRWADAREVRRHTGSFGAENEHINQQCREVMDGVERRLGATADRGVPEDAKKAAEWLDKFAGNPELIGDDSMWRNCRIINTGVLVRYVLSLGRPGPESP